MPRWPENSIVLDATGGLGNRLLALEGAVLLGREIGKRVHINWDRCGFLNTDVHFRSLFRCDSEHFEVIDNRPALVFPRGARAAFLRTLSFLPEAKREIAGRGLNVLWRKTVLRHRDGFDAILRPTTYGVDEGLHWPKELANKKRILIYAHRRFYPGYDSADEAYDYVHPTAELQERIDEITSQFGSNTVGIHVRRIGFNHPHLSPTSEFVNLMRQEIERDEGVKFFLATDSGEERAQFEAQFGSRVICQPSPEYSRGKGEGIKCAVVDMWALSRTARIVGCTWSTFSRMAARLGGIELVLLGAERELAGTA